MMNIAIVTGASSGLGREFAKQVDGLYTKLDEIWLIARREDALRDLASEISIPTKILPFDLMNEADITKFEQLLTEEKPTIRLLINSAGFGILGKFSELSLEEQMNMMHLNCGVLMKITYMSITFMMKNSRIIQIASSAAFVPQANFAVYAASKSFVYSLSLALFEELRHQKIYVTTVCPGPVNTEFFDIAEKHGASLSIKKLTYVEADAVVRDALLASARKKAIAVYGMPMKFARLLTKILPDTFVLRVMGLFK